MSDDGNRYDRDYSLSDDEVTSGKVFIRGRFVWLAWYPLRGLKCAFGRDRCRDEGWHLSAALGPLYLGVGTGVPLP